MKNTSNRPPWGRVLAAGILAAAISFPSIGALSPAPAHGLTPAPGTLTINKIGIFPVNPHGGSPGIYHITVEHVGGITNATTTIKDKLPDEVGLSGPVDVTALTGTVSSLNAVYANGVVEWHGDLSPGARVRVSVPVRVNPCVGAGKTITNVAHVRNTDGSDINDDSVLSITCSAPPNVDVQKSMLSVNEAGDLVPTAGNGVLPGDDIVFRFTTRNNGAETATVFLHDKMPPGVHSTIGDPQQGRRKIEVGPGLTATVDIPARIIASCDIGRVITNVAEYIAVPGGALALAAFDPPPSLPRAQTNVLAMRMHCDDAGDAPDSTNHFGAPMAAYPALGVQANFPTVFDPATGADQGPLHRNPHPFHLGERFTIEGDADLLPDQDGVHNLVPLANDPDNDLADDGVSMNKIAFSDCATATIPVKVYIGPDAAAFFAAHVGNGVGYLNAWVDGNRDGDWADVRQCVGTDGARPAFEHIIIDQPITIGALGMGLHTLNVPTGLVPWPSAAADKPAWLRFTLSELPSNKTLALNGKPYGDGRGYAAPSLTGETEDYLLRAEKTADVTVRKRGAMRTETGAPITGTTTATATDHVVWQIQYANLGNADAVNTALTDDLTDAGSRAVFKVTSVPPVSYTLTGDALSFNLGTLAPGAEGLITVELDRLLAHRIYTNTATITATNDTDAGNNTAQAAVRHAFIQPPLLLNPLDGTTCNGDFTGVNTVLVLTSEFATVDLFLDGVLTATGQAGASGYFRADLKLADGAHDLYAVAHLNGHDSVGETNTVIVNSALSWDPLSLRFIDVINGGKIRPIDANGRTDETGWTPHLLANHAYTVSVRACCDSPSATLSINISGTDIALTDPDGDRIFQALYTTPASVASLTFSLTVDCDGVTSESGSQVLIDPDGVVYDARTGARVSGASVACLQQNTGSTPNATYSAWSAADFGQVNPLSSNGSGYFAFFTPPGLYRLDVSKPGYQPYRSPDLEVADAPVRHDVPLTPVFAQTPVQTVTIGPAGFSPAAITVKAGDVVSWLNGDTKNHSVIGQNGLFNSGALTPGASYTWQFTQTGTISVFDLLSERSMVVNVTTGGLNHIVLMPIAMR